MTGSLFPSLRVWLPRGGRGGALLVVVCANVAAIRDFLLLRLYSRCRAGSFAAAERLPQCP